MKSHNGSTKTEQKFMKIETGFTRLIGCDLPIIIAPMFLVSNVEMVIAGSNAGAVGSFPALNARPAEKLREWLREINRQTKRPYAVNLIVNRTNIFYRKQMEICLDEQVPLIIASLGNPTELISKAHEAGSKVFCDVITLEHARKAVDAGADGLIAVGSGAGGHAGNISPFVWIPYLKKQFDLPIVAAGGIADGRGLAAALALGASGVSMGTRFIASKECPVTDDYKTAILRSQPRDVVTTYKLDGVPANVINTRYVRRMGTELNWFERQMNRNKKLRQMIMALRTFRSIRLLNKAAQRPTWKQLWGAGQVAGLIEEIAPIEEILQQMAKDYQKVRASLPAG